ncbi:TolC family protein [Chitinophaga sancti]|uniref:Outer membrane efflux protein n=1 Tax=Chitinophaga sancti TaxID=1004 RepID=A0A1K1N6M0_9BACT|nr:TolC family protein [Chitinophaga sancti]WQD63494.1 TolC family protein [Chitinophaga sancti]WQG90880.1 TolC family protein [Chitinophaga sancti]SFW31080.1 Outer membrane efflux protein [Chitinophaga sancti]
MKQHICIVLFFLATALTVSAQNKTLPATPSKDVSAEDIQEKLVQLAYENPDLKVRVYEKQRAQYELNKAKGNWLNYVTLGANINDVTTGRYKNSNDYRAQVYYPLWNVGINVPLGSLVSKGSDVKVARSNVKIASAQEESAKRQIKAMVLSKYHDYLMNKQLLTMQNEITEDDFAAFTQAESKLAAGSISYDAYSSASQLYNSDRTKKLNLERDLANVKLEIEELIGVKLETVIAQ